MKKEQADKEEIACEQTVVSATKSGCLDSSQLAILEEEFRSWASKTGNRERQISRQRILLIFLMIRYTGAKLNEVLALNLRTDIDCSNRCITFPVLEGKTSESIRNVQISESFCAGIHDILEVLMAAGGADRLGVDPAFVRRKFYEQAESCGFNKQLGGPEMIRKARALELLQGNMPLPAVQVMLGHSSPSLTASHVSFSKNSMRKVVRKYLERESVRKTSARNSFTGRVSALDLGDIQAMVTLAVSEQISLVTIITLASLRHLGLEVGSLLTAEVKAPWILIAQGKDRPQCSAENCFSGTVVGITRGKITTEYVLQIAENIQLCAILANAQHPGLSFSPGDLVWAMFSCHAVVLHVDE